MLLLLACHSLQKLPPPLSLEMALSTTDPHAATFTVSAPATVTCTSADDERQATADQDGVIRGLLAEETYNCLASAEDYADSPAVSLTPPALPADLSLPVIRKEGDAGFHLLQLSILNPVDQGDLLSGRYLVVFDDQGRPRWQFPGGGGDVDVSWVGKEEILFGGTGMDTVYRPMIVDLDGNLLWEEPETVDWKGRTLGGWNHDVGLSYDGTRVLALVHDLGIGADPLDFGVVELDRETGEVLNYLDVFVNGVAALPEPDGADPYHPNSIWDDESRIYVNLRGASRLLCFDRSSGELLWWMGMGGQFQLLDTDGTPLPDDQWFFNAHDAKVIDGRLTIFDNGLERGQLDGPSYSRVLSMRIDETARTATIESAWQDPRVGAKWLAPIWGGVDPIPGGLSVAISNLWWLNDEGPHSALLHVNDDQKLTWGLEFEDPHVGLYRSEWRPEFP